MNLYSLLKLSWVAGHEQVWFQPKWNDFHKQLGKKCWLSVYDGSSVPGQIIKNGRIDTHGFMK